MSRRIREHIRGNVVGYVAVFLALTGGTAWATHPNGANTISSGDIIDGEVHDTDIGAGQVKNADIAANAVAGGKVANDSLTKEDLAAASVGFDELAPSVFFGGDIAPEPPSNDEYGLAPESVHAGEIANGNVTSAHVANQSLGSVDLGAGSVGSSELSAGSVGTSEVTDGALKGGDIDESTLTPLDGHDAFTEDCNPESGSFVTCGELTFTLGRRMQVLTTFNYGFAAVDTASGVCVPQLDGSTTASEELLTSDDDFFSGGGIPIVDVVTLNAGTHAIRLRCKEETPSFFVSQVRLAAVELGMD